MVKSKFFWTCLSFLAFSLFFLAILSHQYWLNIFVIGLGMLIDKKGSDTLFSKKHRVTTTKDK